MHKSAFLHRLCLAPVLCVAASALALAQPAGVNIPVANPPSQSPAIHRGAIGLGTWNATAEFKDIVVTAEDGTILYRSDFQKAGSSGWTVMRGAWSVRDGVMAESIVRSQCRAFLGDTNWSNYTISLRARKTGGAEGFAIYFNYRDPYNWTYFNVGGWTNTMAGVQFQSEGGPWTWLGRGVPLSVASNVWYDVRIVLKGELIECYLDSKLILTENYSSLRPAAPVAAAPAAPLPAAPPQKRPFPLFYPVCRGAVGVGAANTVVEFSNLVVTSHNQVLYRSDFNHAAMDGWLTSGGNWTVTNGALRQSEGDFTGLATIGDTNWSNYSLTVQARKIAGDDGFRVAFGCLDDDNCVWFNVGSGGGQNATVEENVRGHDITLTAPAPLNITTGIWYNVQVVVSGVRAACYVNSNLIQTAAIELAFSTNAVYLGSSTVADGHVLRFRAGQQVFTASLAKDRGWPAELEPGSLVQVTGQIEPPSATGGPALDAQCDLELFSGDDLLLLQGPSWWTGQRILSLAGIFLAVLTAGAIWTTMIWHRNRLLTLAQRELKNANEELELRVRNRTADLAQANADLKREQTLFRTLLDNSSDYIYFKDLESRFIRCSVSLCRRSGLSHEQIMGRTDLDIFQEEHARRAFADEQEIIRTNRPLIGQPEKEVHPDGSITWVLTTKMPWHGPDGKVIGTFGISRDITSQKDAEAALEQTHQQLVEASRAAGMADVATGVLHNVGNVLNSVNVSTTLLAELWKTSKVNLVGRLASLMKAHGGHLADFITKDPQGRTVPEFLEALAEQLAREQAQALEELTGLQKNVTHITEIVTMQQNYATVSGVTMIVKITELLDDVLRLTESSLHRHGVKLVKEFGEHLPDLTVDRHKVLQILVNLIRNAKQACDDSQRLDKQLTLSASAENGRLRIRVADNGVGIPAENLTRIFAHGFTTRKSGHGFGLHSSALAAREIGGQLSAHSDGPGQGATFTLELNLNPVVVPTRSFVLDAHAELAAIPD